ncbi:8-oxo-dGTP pyrophosphatase MutT (NUDIX family) [Streptacidiphilus sp. MAP5-52]
MGRTEYLNDPSAPKANTLIPASNLLVVNASGEILLQRRRDTGQWALPGGAQDIGETAGRRVLAAIDHRDQGGAHYLEHGTAWIN